MMGAGVAGLMLGAFGARLNSVNLVRSVLGLLTACDATVEAGFNEPVRVSRMIFAAPEVALDILSEGPRVFPVSAAAKW